MNQTKIGDLSPLHKLRNKNTRIEKKTHKNEYRNIKLKQKTLLKFKTKIFIEIKNKKLY